MILVGVAAIAICIIGFFMFVASSNISDIKNDDFVGKTVTVSGTVSNTISIGSLSGYTLEDSTDSISVSSEALPAEGTKVRVTGVLMHDSLFGYYVNID